MLIEVLKNIGIAVGIISIFVILLKVRYKRIPLEDVALLNKHYKKFKWYHVWNLSERLMLALCDEADEKIAELKELIEESNTMKGSN